MPPTVIGVDVSQEYLDAYVRPAAQSRRFANTAAGIAELIDWVRPYAAERIVFESTGRTRKPRSVLCWPSDSPLSSSTPAKCVTSPRP